MRLTTIPLLAMILASCDNVALSRFESVCRENAGITIVDSDGWKALIRAVQAVDLDQQRVSVEARRKGVLVAPPDTDRFIRPFPYVAGYEFRQEHDNFYGQSQPESVPRRNNETVMRDGHAIAVVRNFEMRLPGFETSEYYSCTGKFPELYGIKRAAIIK